MLNLLHIKLIILYICKNNFTKSTFNEITMVVTSSLSAARLDPAGAGTGIWCYGPSF